MRIAIVTLRNKSTEVTTCEGVRISGKECATAVCRAANELGVSPNELCMALQRFLAIPEFANRSVPRLVQDWGD